MKQFGKSNGIVELSIAEITKTKIITVEISKAKIIAARISKVLVCKRL